MGTPDQLPPRTMSMTISRGLLRQSQAFVLPSSSSALFLRSASSASATASATADQTADKAKASANAGADQAKKYIDQASQTGSKVLNQVSERANSMLGSYREPIVYNFAVAREVAKQVYISEKLAPPTNLQDLRGAYEECYNPARDPAWWRSILESGAWKKIALYAVEAYGIFTIGEMIGRRHVVGYKVE